MKPPAYYRGKEQTYVKHFFLEQYLETVAFHIGYTHKEFVYVDCFSVSTIVEPGSAGRWSKDAVAAILQTFESR